MDDRTFDALVRIVYDKAGIALGPQKESLVSARIGKRLRALNLPDAKSYLKYLQADNSGEEVVQLLDVISTNFTSFFREAKHFDMLDKLLRQWRAEGHSRMRLWCAAASSGEEPYTLAMVASEALEGNSTDFRILATDISTKVLRKCLQGTYPPDKVDGIPQRLLHHYFGKTADGEWSANAELRALLTFRRMNLSETPFALRGPLDVVFCRNVMIYFDTLVRSKLVAEIHRLLRPGGYLFIGHSESLTGLGVPFRTVMPSVYVKD